MSTDGVYPPECAAVVRALWTYLDRELDEAAIAAIDGHLAACEYCHEHAAFERHLVDAIRTLRAQRSEPDTLRARVLDALRRTRSADPER